MGDKTNQPVKTQEQLSAKDHLDVLALDRKSAYLTLIKAYMRCRTEDQGDKRKAQKE